MLRRDCRLTDARLTSKKHRSKRHGRGSVRIIGGMWRGRRLTLPPNSPARPTPDRVRETLFNWLAPYLPSAACLDLYAGSGALGLEALSRGASSALFVERDRRHGAALEASLVALDAQGAVVHSSVEKFLSTGVERRFDIVFADPPYTESLEPLLRSLDQLLAPGGVFYCERPRDGGLPDIQGMQWRRRARAGAVEFGIAAAARHDAAPAAEIE